jgi:hypothetical protein
MNKLHLLLLCLPLLAVGCAHQPYPELPDDIAVQQGAAPTPRPTASGAGSVDANATGLAANVSEVARREAQLAPVSQEVNPPPPDPESLPAADARRLEILLGDQRFQYFEDDQLVWSGKITVSKAGPCGLVLG